MVLRTLEQMVAGLTGHKNPADEPVDNMITVNTIIKIIGYKRLNRNYYLTT